MFSYIERSLDEILFKKESFFTALEYGLLCRATTDNPGALLLYTECSVLPVLEQFGIPFKQLSHLRAQKRKLLYFTSCSLLNSELVLTIYLGKTCLFTVLGVTARLKIKLYQYQLLTITFISSINNLERLRYYFLSQQSLESILKTIVELATSISPNE